MSSLKKLDKFGKCKQEGHQKHDIIMICLEKNCDQKKLGCGKCICEIHYSHPNKCLFIEDILQENIEKIENIPNWTNSQLCQKLEKMIQNVDETKDEPLNWELLRENLCEKMQDQKQELIEKYATNKKESINLNKEIQENFQIIYSLEQIQKLYQQYVKKEIDIQEFQKQLQQYLLQDKRSQSYKKMEKIFKKKDRVCLQISKAQFKDCKEYLVKQIQTLHQVLKTASIQFIIPEIQGQVTYNRNIKTIKEGYEYHFSQSDAQSYLYSNQILTFDQGKTEFALTLENLSSTQSFNFYVGVVLDSQKDQINSMFNQSYGIQLDILQQAQSQPYFKTTPGKKTINEVFQKNGQDKKPTKIIALLDLNKKEFVVTTDDNQGQVTHSLQNMKAHQRNNFQVQSESIYNKNNKYRAYVLGYSANFKVVVEKP